MKKRWPYVHKVVQGLKRGLNYVPACEGAPLSTNTMMRWRRENPRLDRLILAAMGKSDEKRTDAVEDAMFRRLANGNATPAEYIFYLCNRRPQKWQNNYRFEHGGKIALTTEEKENAFSRIRDIIAIE